jgi:hypothetical protein
LCFPWVADIVIAGLFRVARNVAFSQFNAIHSLRTFPCEQFRNNQTHRSAVVFSKWSSIVHVSQDNVIVHPSW